MEDLSRSTIKERIVAAILLGCGIAALAYSIAADNAIELQGRDFILAIVFAGAIILADYFPIHILRGTKLSLNNLPIFLAAVLLPVSLAVLATATGLLIALSISRKKRGLLLSDMASTVGQWMLTSFLGYQIIHLQLPGIQGHISKYGLLLLCASTFLLADFLIFSLSQSFLFQEPFGQTLLSVIKEGILLELLQYLIAVIGALAAYEDIWSLLLLVVPLGIAYVAFKNLKETRFETIQVLEDMADTVDLRDIYTGGHSKRVAELVEEILGQLNICGPEATLITMAARLHDIGKIGIPDNILKKPGKLLPHEMAVMRTHPAKGAELISKHKDFSRGAQMILYHHERWDGMGYPAGLKEHQIPFGARIIAVADSFDAMISDRPYRKALSTQQAMHVLLDGRGSQWDSAIVSAFIDLISGKIAEGKWDGNPMVEAENPSVS